MRVSDRPARRWATEAADHPAPPRCLRVDRQAGKVEHELRALLRQRLFGIACGHADGNDAAGLSDDPIHKLLMDRDPLSGRALASQPTLSRFENAVGAKDLIRLSEALAETVIGRHRRVHSSDEAGEARFARAGGAKGRAEQGSRRRER